MITLTHGDLFDSGCQTLVNATNTEGIMGGGIALVFKQQFPAMFRAYQAECKDGMHTIDVPMLYKYPDPGPWILNLATKDLVRNDSSIEAIKAGLRWVVRNYKAEGITSMAFPALGCGLGGLEWKDVQPVMMYFLGKIDKNVEIKIYEPLAPRRRLSDRLREDRPPLTGSAMI